MSVLKKIEDVSQMIDRKLQELTVLTGGIEGRKVSFDPDSVFEALQNSGELLASLINIQVLVATSKNHLRSASPSEQTVRSALRALIAHMDEVGETLRSVSFSANEYAKTINRMALMIRDSREEDIDGN